MRRKENELIKKIVFEESFQSIFSPITFEHEKVISMLICNISYSLANADIDTPYFEILHLYLCLVYRYILESNWMKHVI